MFSLVLYFSPLFSNKGGLSLKTHQNTLQTPRVWLVILGVSLLLLVGGCASQQPPPQPDMQAPPSAIETEPTVIELDDSKLADALQEGDIPEEDRGQLPWLPKRPPLGMTFEETSALQNVYFEFDKYSLTADARTVLNNNAVWLRNNPAVSVQIEGHCDERGTLEYNQVLGENRAIAVKKYLVTLGIDPDRLYTISYGETQPLEPGHNEEAWAKNRRAHFKVSR
ncbi:peptidoglycan-associated lipoprotein Pal [candidate division KSB3 bacterium]|uniref:Peptidoglycan-associated protein n=1 Tax=candidate division KSB3 bacterium TaxID=2044937 RepID=A0A9D5JZ91_9BACT|nr:peptidoglycan-associated lipoprotein Pal [candidate division KSB3 bacterium]